MMKDQLMTIVEITDYHYQNEGKQFICIMNEKGLENKLTDSENRKIYGRKKKYDNRSDK